MADIEDEEFFNYSLTANFSMDDYDITIFEAFSKPARRALIIMYAITAIYSFIGNSTVIFVMLCGTKSSRDLKLLLINLAVSDITMAIFCIPFTYTQVVLNRWVFAPEFCPIVYTMQQCSVSVSVYTLTAISVDRCYAILYPLKTAWTKSHGLIVIAVIWVLSILTSIYQVVGSRAEPFEWGSITYYECRETFDSKVVTIVVFLFTFLFPLYIMSFCYSVICIELRKDGFPKLQQRKRNKQQNKKKIKAIRMLFVVVFVFAVCWLPLHVFSLSTAFFPEITQTESKTYQNIYLGSFIACHWLAMANSFVNPFIYSFMCENFRADGKNILGSLGFKSFKKDDPFMTAWRRRTIESRASTMTANSVKLTTCRSISPRGSFPTM